MHHLPQNLLVSREIHAAPEGPSTGHIRSSGNYSQGSLANQNGVVMQAIPTRPDSAGRFSFPLDPPGQRFGQIVSAEGTPDGSPLVVVDDNTDLPPATRPGEVYVICLEPGQNYGWPVLRRISENAPGTAALLHYIAANELVDVREKMAEVALILSEGVEA